MKSTDYAKLFTKRKDGIYQKYVNGRYLYSKDPKELYDKWQELLHPEEKSVYFKDVAEEWEKFHREQIDDRTWNNYRPHYESILSKNKNTKIEDITVQTILTDLNWAKLRGYSLTIAKTRKTIYKQILDYAVIQGYIQYNPALSAKLPSGFKKGRRVMPEDKDIKIICKNVDAEFGFFPFLLLCTGMRKGEALALTRSDIDLNKKEISISKSLTYVNGNAPKIKSPKTESSYRTIPVMDILYDQLKEYLANLKGDILFPANKSNRNPGGGYMTEKGYDFAWSNYCKKVGLNITAHQLRHTTATLMFESGVDEYTAQRILGHSNISTTMGIYTELRENQQKKSIKKLEKGLKKYKV